MAEAKKANWLVRAWRAICRYFRELRSELKKVVWSTPKQVAKNTVIVIACVLIVGIFIWLVDLVADAGIIALKDAVAKIFAKFIK